VIDRVAEPQYNDRKLDMTRMSIKTYENIASKLQLSPQEKEKVNV
jgi:hypothetical protein